MPSVRKSSTSIRLSKNMRKRSMRNKRSMRKRSRSRKYRGEGGSEIEIAQIKSTVEKLKQLENHICNDILLKMDTGHIKSTNLNDKDRENINSFYTNPKSNPKSNPNPNPNPKLLPEQVSVKKIQFNKTINVDPYLSVAVQIINCSQTNESSPFISILANDEDIKKLINANFVLLKKLNIPEIFFGKSVSNFVLTTILLYLGLGIKTGPFLLLALIIQSANMVVRIKEHLADTQFVLDFLEEKEEVLEEFPKKIKEFVELVKLKLIEHFGKGLLLQVVDGENVSKFYANTHESETNYIEHITYL